MREIKFRAYHKEHKIMCEVLLICFVNRYVDVLPEYEIEGGLQDSWSFDVIELMQFTGLKDKNGVDIYEGDEVTYSDKSTSLTVGFESGSFVLKRDGKTYVYNINSRVLEVIGNIHESAAELKDK